MTNKYQSFKINVNHYNYIIIFDKNKLKIKFRDIKPYFNICNYLCSRITLSILADFNAAQQEGKFL